jgi:hypothetical protein
VPGNPGYNETNLPEGGLMAECLQEWAEVLSAIGTILMMLAWVFYAQFGIVTYLRQRRPRIVIDKTAEDTIDTRFVVVNLSEFPIYISGILVVVRRGQEEIAHKIQKYSRSSTEDGQELDNLEYAESQLRHGTLDVGQLFMMGSSQETLSWLLDDDAEDSDQERPQRIRKALEEVDLFEFRVVAMAGNDDHPVASSRQFKVEYQNEDIVIYPSDEYTRQFSSWRDRNYAEEWARQLRTL